VVTREKPDRPIGWVTRSALWQAIESANEQRAGQNPEEKLNECPGFDERSLQSLRQSSIQSETLR
jgi:hypothetical protein